MKLWDDLLADSEIEITKDAREKTKAEGDEDEKLDKDNNKTSEFTSILEDWTWGEVQLISVVRA